VSHGGRRVAAVAAVLGSLRIASAESIAAAITDSSRMASEGIPCILRIVPSAVTPDLTGDYTVPGVWLT